MTRNKTALDYRKLKSKNKVIVYFLPAATPSGPRTVRVVLLVVVVVVGGD